MDKLFGTKPWDEPISTASSSCSPHTPCSNEAAKITTSTTGSGNPNDIQTTPTSSKGNYCCINNLNYIFLLPS